MSNYIKGVLVGSEVKQYDYNALGNKPSLVSVDSTLAVPGKAADAKVVGTKFTELEQSLNERVDTHNFTLIGDVTLTEANSGVDFITDFNGVSLAEYKDFFLYFKGNFIESTACQLAIRTQDGLNYQCYLPISTIDISSPNIWWHLSEEIGRVDEYTIRKGIYPSDFLKNSVDDTLGAQGLDANNRSVKSDVSVTTATNADYRVFIFNRLNQFTPGSRFVLFGRKRT